VPIVVLGISRAFLHAEAITIHLADGMLIAACLPITDAFII